MNQKLAPRLQQRVSYRADLASNGLEASRQSTARWAPDQRPRIVAMTANATAGDRDACITAAMDDCVTKPIRTETPVTALLRIEPRS